jgi:hypothetical protein
MLSIVHSSPLARPEPRAVASPALKPVLLEIARAMAEQEARRIMAEK